MYTKENGKLIETIEQPIMVIRRTKEEVVSELAASEVRCAIKAAEYAGAQQEVVRLQELLAKCVELGVAEKE